MFMMIFSGYQKSRNFSKYEKSSCIYEFSCIIRSWPGQIAGR